MMPSLEKASLYETAYSPEEGCYVKIENAWMSLNGTIIYECTGDFDDCKIKWFRHGELTQHCL